WECGTYGGAGAAPNADTLVVRRAAEEPEAPAAGRLQIQSARVLDSTLFVGANMPAGYTAEHAQPHRLIANGYGARETATPPTPSTARASSAPTCRPRTRQRTRRRTG